MLTLAISLTLALIISCVIYTSEQWRRFLKSFVFLSFSSEQTKFEEEFRYLIVTFSLSDKLSDPPIHISRIHDSKKLLSQLFYGSTAGFIVLISMVYWNSTLLIGLITTYFTLCCLLFRYHKFTELQFMHKLAMDSIHRLISLFQESENLQSQNLKSGRQQQLGKIFTDHFAKYTYTINQLHPLIDIKNLARLRDMYKVKESPSSISKKSEYDQGDIERMYLLGLWKRHDYFLHLLALSNKTRNWKQAIQISEDLIQEFMEFNEKLTQIMDHSPVSESDDKQMYAVIHRLCTVETTLQDLEANVRICQQDARLGANLHKNFNIIDNTIQQMIAEWEDSKQCLTRLDPIPSPPSSPAKI